ncbi:ankyrin-1 [Lingula anatina]|uniref:Ankyrin-1 n=1 Tax=Lingula anatina TaxID=7574 RepID=A0A1S3K279_LINAN|nr:ankyrin-1 [Lingula anatina]|eukprot:XP_013416743.1 ankyrin-1 [Lingula anatina]
MEYIEPDIYNALKNDNAKTLDEFLEAGFDVNHTFCTKRIPPQDVGLTLLHVAVKSKNSNVIKLLIKRKCDVNVLSTQDPGSYLPSTVKHLGKNLKQSSLYLAVVNNDVETVKVLVTAGADLKLCDDMGCSVLWHITDLYGDISMARTIIKSGQCAINYADIHGLGPLHVAVIRGNIDFVKFLMRSRAVVDLEQCEGATPLCLACKYAKKEAVQVLLQHGANPNHIGRNNISPVSCAIGFMRNSKGNFNDVLAPLIMAGAALPSVHRIIASLPKMYLVMYPEFHQWLLEHASKPRRLMELCGHVIRQQLGRARWGQSAYAAVEQLPLPNFLKDYVELRHL